MKKLVILALLALILGGHIFASAALYDRGTDSLGNHLIYDSGLNITWYDYSNSYNTWQNQVNWAVGLTVNFEGNIYDDWRLPTTVDGPLVFGWDGTTTAGHNITSSEMGHLFYTELGNKGYYDTNGNYPQPGWGLTNKGPFQHLEAYWHCRVRRVPRIQTTRGSSPSALATRATTIRATSAPSRWLSGPAMSPRCPSLERSGSWALV